MRVIVRESLLSKISFFLFQKTRKGEKELTAQMLLYSSAALSFIESAWSLKGRDFRCCDDNIAPYQSTTPNFTM